jgi:hypothetical protein
MNATHLRSGRPSWAWGDYEDADGGLGLRLHIVTRLLIGATVAVAVTRWAAS